MIEDHVRSGIGKLYLADSFMSWFSWYSIYDSVNFHDNMFLSLMISAFYCFKVMWIYSSGRLGQLIEILADMMWTSSWIFFKCTFSVIGQTYFSTIQCHIASPGLWEWQYMKIVQYNVQFQSLHFQSHQICFLLRSFAFAFGMVSGFKKLASPSASAASCSRKCETYFDYLWTWIRFQLIGPLVKYHIVNLKSENIFWISTVAGLGIIFTF